jgi:ferrous iron transport protein B
VIVAVSVVLWILSHLPLHDGHMPAIADSFVGNIGHTIEPLIRPLGFNWKIGIGLITSLAAREAMVGTLALIYGSDNSFQSASLQQAVHADLTLAGALALLIFFAFAMQCMSTTAVVRRETGGWKWPIIQFAYMSGLAWVCAFLTYRIVTLF